MTTKEQITNILNSFDLDESLKINITKSLLKIATSKKENKIISVVELIEDSIDRFSDIDKDIDYIEIRPVLDGINLLLEKNTAIKIVDSENKEISTYKCLEEGMNKTNITEINISEDFKLQIALIDDRMLKRLDASEESMIEKLFEELKNRNLINNIEKAIRYNPDKKNEGNDWKKISFEPYYFEGYKDQDLKQKIVEKLRKLISDSLKLVQNNESIKIKGLEAPNVFSVIRYASNKRKKLNLTYTAQILLSKNQLEQLSDSFIQDKDCKVDESKQNALKRILEDPLDGKSTSEADNCFKHENVRFDIFSESEKAKTDTDLKRSEIESKIYKYINPNSEKPLVYIPIHLNGSAWMAIYRIRTTKDIDYMSFYRNKISYIGNQIRTRAYETFFWMYRNEMESIFAKKNDIQLSVRIDSINDYGMALSCFFPYYIPIFPPTHSSQSINEYLNSIGSKKYCFKFNMNQIWANQIDYDNLSVDKYEERIKRHINRINANMLSELNYIKIIEASYSVGHLLKNKLGSSLKVLGEIEIRIKNFITEHYPADNDIVYNRNFKTKIQAFEKSNMNNIKLLTIMDIVPKSYAITKNENHFEIFLDKSDFNTENDIDLIKMIENISEELSLSKLIDFKICKAKIKPFIYDSEKKINVCPFTDFYEICILESLINYSKYTFNRAKLIVDIFDEEENAIVLRNQCNDNEDLNPNFVEVGPHFGFLGAISYINNAYKKTGVGSVKYRIIDIDGKKHFELGLFLNSLKY